MSGEGLERVEEVWGLEASGFWWWVEKKEGGGKPGCRFYYIGYRSIESLQPHCSGIDLRPSATACHAHLPRGKTKRKLSERR